MSSLLSASVESTSCAANNLTSCKLRKWNLIAICACCAIGVGGVSLSLYLYKKHTKLKKSLDELEKKLELLTEKFEKIESSSNQQHRSRRSNINSSLSSRRSSFVSRSESESWNTPNTSPTRTVKSVEFLLDENHNNDLDDFNNQSGSNVESTKVLKEEDFMSDNRSLELLQMQTLENKKLISANNQNKYENEPNDQKYSIDYIKSLYVLGESETEIELKKEFRLKAYEIAKTQLEIYPNSYLSHKWYAIAAGRVVDYYSINEKVKLGFEFKDHLDIAIGMNDSDYLLYYLRGRWTFKMLNLSWAERYGVRLIFGKIPNVSIEYAMEDFLKVEELHKNKSKGSTLHLAKCYINQGNIDEALNYLSIAKDLPTRTNEHLNDNEEIESLLKQYSN